MELFRIKSKFKKNVLIKRMKHNFMWKDAKQDVKHALEISAGL